VKPLRDTEEGAARRAACGGHKDTMEYFVEERKISVAAKYDCVGTAVMNGQLDCLKYLVEEAKAPFKDSNFIACARYYEEPECLNYLLENGCPEPTDEEYVAFILRRG
jgi:hypothetical protein